MPNKGTKLEWELRSYLQSKGYYVIRSAASHNIDLVTFSPEGFTECYEVKALPRTWDRLYLSRSCFIREQFELHAQLQQRLLPQKGRVYYATKYGDEWVRWDMDQIGTVLKVSDAARF